MSFTYILIALNAGTLLLLAGLYLRRNNHKVEEQLGQMATQQQTSEQQLRENLLTNFGTLQQNIIERLGNVQLEQSKQSTEALKMLQDSLQKGAQENRQQVKEALTDHANLVGKRVEALTLTTENRLKEINTQVEKRLVEGFEKTNETFGNVIKRLAMIDAAQQKITELSTNVVSLQEILNDKRSRGAFGEVQLSALIHNMIPEQNCSFQHLLSNGKRPDCMLFLPEPTGNIAVDAKFPLEAFRTMVDSNTSDADRVAAERQFKLDLRKHIHDIASKYIIPGETSDGAVMFIPAEAVFAEIHAHHSDIVDIAQKAKIWLVSPTTMMAILTTARAVLKDAATRKQVLEIQKHLHLLGDDFRRFQLRMDSLAQRIEQAHDDVSKIHISSRKITQRFTQIEKADLEGLQLEEPVEELGTA